MAIDTKNDPERIQTAAAIENEIESTDFDQLVLIGSIKKRIHYYRHLFRIRKRINRLSEEMILHLWQVYTKTGVTEQLLNGA